MSSVHLEAFARLLEQPFGVGVHQVDPRSNTIVRGDEVVSVEPKVMRVLVCLAAAPGEVVSRATLHAAVWPETIVSDNVLTRAISELRKALGDSSRNPQFIETISKGGYRLMVAVNEPARATTVEAIDLGGDSLEPPIDVVPHVPEIQVPRSRWPLGIGLGAISVVVLLAMLRPWENADPSHLSFVSAEPLTTYRGHELQPRISPDGNLVVFAWQGEAGNNWDLYIQQPGTSAPLRRTDHPGDDVQPVWSPDGTSLVFRRYEGEACSIILVAALAGTERVLAPCYGTTLPNRVHWAPRLTWSPDGKWLAYASRTAVEEPISIYRLSLESFEKERLTYPDSASMGDIQPAYSPDGQALSFVRFEAWGRSELYVVSLQDGTERQMTNDSRMLRGHTWTPDGQHLLFSSDRGGTFDFWKMPQQGGVPVWIPATGWNVKQPAFSAEGDLVYESWTYDTNIWYTSFDSSAGATTRIVASTLWDEQPRLSPDGQHLAFVSNRTGSYELWISDADGHNAIQYTFFGDAVVQAPAWSPDNQHLAFDVRRGAEASIFTLDLESGQTHPFSDLAVPSVQPEWARDGDALYYAVYDQQRWQLVKHNMSESEPMRITHEGGFVVQEAVDGHLYFAKSEEAGLWRWDAVQNDELLMFPDLRLGDWANWEVTSEGIVYITRQVDGVTALNLYRFADAVTIRLRAFASPPLSNQRSLALRPDGLGVYHTQLDDTESDIMVMRVGANNE